MPNFIRFPRLVGCYNFLMKKYLCLGCGFSYDEARGLPEHGIAPGTRWADIPEDWVCPDCGTPKSGFEMVEIPYYSEAQPA
jgi:rubredoxin